MTRVLVHARGTVGSAMGSTGVRCYHMARVLAESLPDARVTLAVPYQPDIESPHPRLRIVHPRNAWSGLLLMLRHDVIISRNFPPTAFLLFFFKRLVLDFYAALFIEWLTLAAERIGNPRRRNVWAAANRYYINAQLTLADYIVCSSERQRDAWVGALSALNLIGPETYDADPSLRGLIDTVPYGVRSGCPQPARRVLKGVLPGIRENDKVLIWNGSVVDWFDAPTVIRAMAEIGKVRDDVKLFFLGTDHPDRVVHLDSGPPHEAHELSRELGLLDRTVFFNMGWTPYEEIGDYLAEADIGVCAAFDNLEARYAFRTRFVDLFWAELPIVCTRGDVLADRVEQDPLGIAVPPGDHHAFAQAVMRLLDDDDFYQRCRRNLASIKEELGWERVLAPLVEFCRHRTSVALPKRRRVVPLLRRTMQYVFTHAWQETVTRKS